jgi:predicted PurR-regulated permease PerM
MRIDKNQPYQGNLPQIFIITTWLIFIYLLTYGLIIARSILYPIFLAILFTYLLYPLGRFFETRLNFPRIMANISCLLVAFAVLSASLYLLYNQALIFLVDLPALRNRAIANIWQISNMIEDTLGIPAYRQQEWFYEFTTGFFDLSTAFLERLFTATTGTLTAIALMPIYIFFFLYYRNKFREFMLRLIPEPKHRKILIILHDVSFVTKKYMSGIVIVVFILAILNSFGLYLIGLEHPVLLGIISALFNLIPYFGTLIGGIVPLIMSLLTGTLSQTLGVVIYFILIQFTENNILTPNIVGNNVKLSPFFIIISIIAGGLLWGLPGMLMAVPYLAMFKILCDHVEKLQPISFLLGTQGTEKHALTFKKILRFFKIKSNKKDPEA